MNLTRIVTVCDQWEYLDWLRDDSLFDPNIEYLVIDDASPTSPPELLMEAFRGRGIRYHRLPKNSGRSAARNAGAGLARADYIEFVDGDDRPLPILWDPVWAGFDLVFFPAASHGPEAGSYSSHNVKHFLLPDPLSPTGFRDPRPANTLWRKAAFERLGRFDPRMEPIEDLELAWRARTSAASYAVAPKQSYNHHGSNHVKGMISTIAFIRFYQQIDDGAFNRGEAIDNEVKNLWLQATWHLMDRGYLTDLFRKGCVLIYNVCKASIRAPWRRHK